METRIDVLDKGYVEVIGDPWTENPDLWIANAARASFAKRSTQMTERDERLIRDLMHDIHKSPLRHRVITFEIKAPLVVTRQWFKYHVGSNHGEDSAELLGLPVHGNGDDGSDDPMFGRNEMSRRYVTREPEFYHPKEWRSAPEIRRQGSGGPVESSVAQAMDQMQTWINETCLHAYQRALSIGVAAEQARLLLPAYALYTSWWWTASYDGVFHFLDQRLRANAQHEITQYAKAIYQLVLSIAPVATSERLKDVKLDA